MLGELGYYALLIGFFVGMFYLARFLLKLLNEREKSSNFFQTNVDTEYRLEFPDKERDQYEHLKEKIKAKQPANVLEQCKRAAEQGGPEAAEAANKWMLTLQDNECKVLIIQLKPFMVKSVANLAQLQKDRPGCYRLWTSKLISEAYWESLVQAEEEVKTDISFALNEVNAMKPGLGERFFDDCVNVWRRERDTVQREEDRLAKIEERKQEQRRAKQDEERAVRMAEKTEKDREKLFNQLIQEEEKEKKKGKKEGAKKKK